jgi:hypothetical protein
MIKRYTRRIMGDVWNRENRFSKMLQVEILSCEAQSSTRVSRETRFQQSETHRSQLVSRYPWVFLSSASLPDLDPSKGRPIWVGLIRCITWRNPADSRVLKSPLFSSYRRAGRTFAGDRRPALTVSSLYLLTK